MPLGKEPSTPDAGSSGASPEVLELKELFPDVDSATLGNVYNAAGKNVDITKKVGWRTAADGASVCPADSSRPSMLIRAQVDHITSVTFGRIIFRHVPLVLAPIISNLIQLHTEHHQTHVDQTITGNPLLEPCCPPQDQNQHTDD
jgi:hypothetical protein